MVDDIAFKFYGDTVKVQFIYESNLGLVDQPLLLPFGILIYLPDVVIEKPNNIIADVWA